MHWDRIAANWPLANGRIRQRWGKLTDEDLTDVAGKRDVLTGKIRQRYGVAQAEAERQVGIWEAQVSRAWDVVVKATSSKQGH